MFKMLVLLVGIICLSHAENSSNFIFKDELLNKGLKNIIVQDKLAELIFENRQEAFNNVDLLLHTSPNAKVEEFLDSFNAGLKHKLLIINGEFVEINADVLKEVFTKNIKKLYKIIYQENYFEDGLLQNTLEDFMKTINLEMVESKILVSEFVLASTQSTKIDLQRSYCQDVANDAQAILVDFWQECYNIIDDPSRFQVTGRFNFFVGILKVTLQSIVKLGTIVVQNITCSSRKRRAVGSFREATIVRKLFSKAVNLFWKVAISSLLKMVGNKYFLIIGGVFVVIVLAFL